LVVDANIILGDLIWLVSKRTNSSAKTQLMETIEAETVEIYAPPIFFDEVEEKIPLLATEKGLDISLMYEHWAIYKTKIKLSSPDPDKVKILRGGKDPDDAEYIALEQTMGAAGVISKNHDIRLMGGNQVSVTCITHLRNYSRSTSIELNIKVNGVMFANLSIAAVQGLFVGAKALINGIGKAPDWVKFALLAGGLYVVLHPGARTAVVSGLKNVLQGIGEATPSIIALIAEAAVLAEKHKSEAQSYLDSAMKELGRNAAIKIEHKVTI
jgi:predicted nucleic acid-binding protein